MGRDQFDKMFFITMVKLSNSTTKNTDKYSNREREKSYGQLFELYRQTWQCV
jgi:hypothetical protein